MYIGLGSVRPTQSLSAPTIYVSLCGKKKHRLGKDTLQYTQAETPTILHQPQENTRGILEYVQSAKCKRISFDLTNFFPYINCIFRLLTCIHQEHSLHVRKCTFLHIFYQVSIIYKYIIYKYRAHKSPIICIWYFIKFKFIHRVVIRDSCGFMQIHFRLTVSDARL